MKTLLYILLLTFTVVVNAQDNDKRERIKALKVAHITERLQLTKTEAQQFWPIYNTFEEQEQQLRKENYSKRKETDVESLSEQEAKKMIEDMLAVENRKNELREKFVKDLQKILPSKKVIKLKIAEEEFNKKMFEEFKKRRGSRNDQP